MNATSADRHWLEAIVLDRGAPQKSFGAPTSSSPRPTAAVPPKLCADEAGGMEMAGAVHGRGRRRADAR